MKQISLEQLLVLHILAVNQGGGSTGVRDIGRLQSVLATQSQYVFGSEIYPSVFEKSAALIRGIICDHPFVDGNKRTAMLTGLTFLEINSIKVTAKKGEIEDYAIFVATRKPTVKAIATWLKEHSK